MSEPDDDRQLRAEVRRLLRDRWVRSALETDGVDRGAVRSEIASFLSAEFGMGSLLDELMGQQAVGACSVAAGVAEELGGALFPNVWLPTWMASVLGAARIDASGMELVWPGPDATWDSAAFDLPTVTDGAVSGRLAQVLIGRQPRELVLPALSGDRCVAAVVSADEASVQPVWLAAEGRELADVEVTAAPSRILELSGTTGGFGAAVASGATWLAAEMVGAATYCLGSARAYAQSRVQFKRPIGTFQAVRHRLADVLVGIESARAAVRRAARAQDLGADPTHRAARIAKVQAARCLRAASEAAVQVHGGMGFTWDVPLHLAVKLWGAGTNLYGTSTENEVLIFRSLSDGRCHPND